MSKPKALKKADSVNEMVEYFIQHRHLFETSLASIRSAVETSSQLKPLIHSIKSRIKDPDHLKEKLLRKQQQAAKDKKPFTFKKKNLFKKINDLAGFRIIHLHTKQMAVIDAELRRIFQEQQWHVYEDATARTWDDESREYFKKIGINVKSSKDLYTSVHYIIMPNSSAGITCEIQVRTLMEEVWGEVSHTINYPRPTDSHSCREQIKVLARVASGCSRLVDSIFDTHQEHKKTPPVSTKKKRKRRMVKAKER